MHKGLEELLKTHPNAQIPVSAATRTVTIKALQEACSRDKLGGEMDTYLMASRLLDRCRDVLRLLEPDWECQVNLQVDSARSDFQTDLMIRDSVDQLLPWEIKAWAMGNVYMPSIVELGAANGGKGSPFIFGGALYNEEAVIARLSLAILSSPRTSFGVLFSGTKMQIFCVRRLPRPHLLVSDPINITAVGPSPVQLILYMLLHARYPDSPPLPLSPTEAMITLPPRPVIDSSRPTLTSSVTVEQLQMQCSAISLCFDFAGAPNQPIYKLSRVEPLSPADYKAHQTPPLDTPPTTWHANGAVKNDNDGTQVVAKFAQRASVQVILREAYFYQHQLKSLQGTVVPMHYGVFSGDRRVVLLMAYAGMTLDSFGGLEPETKKTILDHLILLHRHGVQHNDVWPENVTVGPDGRPHIIDLSHAEVHTCPGANKCHEIIGAARMLKLPRSILNTYHETRVVTDP
ncbi:hypothetical protein BOTBODRAFT_188988 [Botryobasidium botryosum FD-172 SS1]|uniref:Protein kinase domain-containing protein n=1 Tax=Botryobasidium botryosum (strain FD-172 SS1) TaxID=930990 RepID=A0A067MM97_BOTB1|nr:hypothetical protein BOTBODRAFT_188988 [Botryobasidium botryosum FD-172 SS1]